MVERHAQNADRDENAPADAPAEGSMRRERGYSRRGGAKAQRPGRQGAGKGGRPFAPSRRGQERQRSGFAVSDQSGKGKPRDSHDRVVNPRDLRRSNRADREKSPDIAPEISGDELDVSVKAQLRSLEEQNRAWVAKHLVMAGVVLDSDPDLSFRHALAASRRGGRLAVVREAVGLAAYSAGYYAEALRELRTFRRISGSSHHIALMIDCERGLGRTERALELVREAEHEDLDAVNRAELAMVAAGIYGDLGQWEQAEQELRRLPYLQENRGFPFSARLFRVYADILEQLGQTEDAQRWRKSATLSDQVFGAEEAQEIYDVAAVSADASDVEALGLRRA